MNQSSTTSPEEQLLPRLRHELQATRQVYDGQPYWVIKDPLSLRYYRFNREEYFVLEQLRKGVTLKELKEAHAREFRTYDLTTREIALFVNSLMTKNLLHSSRQNRDDLLYSAGKKVWKRKLIGRISNFMFIKIPLWDPDRFFNRVIPHIRFIWSGWFFALYLLLLLVAGGLLVHRWHDFSYMFTEYFFSVRNIPLLFLSVWVVKAIHEFGHGLTCKQYGGEVHEIGFLILVFAPFLYCDITDSWTFTAKWKRLLATAGGIMSELIIAGVATIGWYFTEPPGFWHAWMFNLIITCSFSTILFNANPLLKFDGYYMMMDLIEVPNLRQRSSEFVKSLFMRHILGARSDELPEEHRFRLVFPLYSFAALAYRWFITFAIMYMVYQMLDQLHLAVLGRALVVMTLTTMILMPVVKGTNALIYRRHALGISNTRLMVVLAVVAVLVGVALFCPFTQHVTLPFILEPAQVTVLRNEVDGVLHWRVADPCAPMRAPWGDGERKTPAGLAGRITRLEGQWVQPDPCKAPLAELTNPELFLREKGVLAEIEKTRYDIAYVTSRGASLAEQQLNDRLEKYQKELARIRELIGELTIRPPQAGHILTPDHELIVLEGGYLTRGTPLMLLGDAEDLVAKVWVPENTWSRIFQKNESMNRPAELLLYAFSDAPFRGSVIAASEYREEDMGVFGEKLALSNKVGGEILTEYDPQTDQERPMEAVYEITIGLENDSISHTLKARPYMSGRARIDCGKQTLFRWGYESLLRFISPEIRL